MEFFRPEHWSVLPRPPPGHHPKPGIEPRSPELQADSLPSEPPGKAGHTSWCMIINKMYPYLLKELVMTEQLTQHPYLMELPRFPGGASGKQPACQCRWM